MKNTFLRQVAFAVGLLALNGTGRAAPVDPDKDISFAQELLINDHYVVEAWPKTQTRPGPRPLGIEAVLMGLSRDGTAKTALLDWLKVWVSDCGSPSGSTEVIPVGQRLIDRWKEDDGAARLSDTEWRPNFDHAPFRLLALVNRMDLQHRDADGLPLNAGEGRLVYGVTLGPGNDGLALNATVIFEYELAAQSEADVLLWAIKWHKLGQCFDKIGPEYCEALAKLIADFTGCGAMPCKTNGSALNQIRTNESQLSGVKLGDERFPWRLREFRLMPGTGTFFAATTKQTPGAFVPDSLVAEYINSHEADILAMRHKVPAYYQGTPFLARQVDLSQIGGPAWLLRDSNKSPLVKNPEARFQFAFNTCNGCHGFETGTNFLHISPRIPAESATLSFFLQDKSPVNQVDVPSSIDHPELKEITHRRKIFAEILNGARPTWITFLQGTGSSSTVIPSQELLRLLAARANREE